jgi:uncharacterized protein (UPF0303 family)
LDSSNGIDGALVNPWYFKNRSKRSYAVSMAIVISPETGILAKQEELLVLGDWNQHVAWEIGNLMRSKAVERKLPCIIDIRHGDTTWFYAAMPGSAPLNEDFARRKRNTANYFECSSQLVNFQVKGGLDFIKMSALDPRDYSDSGGSFPIRVNNAGMVGTITVSGMANMEDHELIIHSLAEYLSVDLTGNLL